MNRSYDADALIGPLYFLAFLLVISPVIDFVSGIVPTAFSDLQWRFGAVGLMSGFLLTPLLGIVLAIGVAHYAQHSTVQKALATLNFTLAGLFFVLLVLFVLDVVQLRAIVDPEGQSQFVAAAWKAILKHSLFIVITAWFGVAGFRVAKFARTEKREVGGVVIGA